MPVQLAKTGSSQAYKPIWPSQKEALQRTLFRDRTAWKGAKSVSSRVGQAVKKVTTAEQRAGAGIWDHCHQSNLLFP